MDVWSQSRAKWISAMIERGVIDPLPSYDLMDYMHDYTNTKVSDVQTEYLLQFEPKII